LIAFQSVIPLLGVVLQMESGVQDLLFLRGARRPEELVTTV
jgi:hypothetical protein